MRKVRQEPDTRHIAINQSGTGKQVKSIEL